ncbi:AraC family transcriptional regulator [Saccharothrix luteola]|uniref:AraC family transcriptional regulator n=1 Tax=Saccharothrix luteola TaxID=2893018 RepID=UPI001E422080|nr:AraC family transcriptional regulator [Saccharothrix luteola]MCC8251565.1 AraC family transcriptional regulator [Saccharothrix luteola]
MGPDIAAWRPAVPGIAEVLHARFTDHAYPAHTHDAWTLLLVDTGTVTYGLDHREHGAAPASVTLLPPHVPHDGRNATSEGFRKRVLYLDTSVLGTDLVGAAVDHPAFADPALRLRVHQLHGVLHGGDEWEAESRLALVRDRLHAHLTRRAPTTPEAEPGLARTLRDLLDAHVTDGLTLSDAATRLAAAPERLVRAFTREFGLPPHRYLTGRRVDLARRLLLDGLPPAQVAPAVGFYDQSHLTRHFRRMLGTAPGAYARSGTSRVVHDRS